MSIFGWDYPAGCTSVPDDDYEEWCGVCGEREEECDCPECPECGDVGNRACYDIHGMTRNFPDDGKIYSMEQFLEAEGFDSFYEYGRCLYKYSFGPWIVATIKNNGALREFHHHGGVYYEDDRARDDDWYPFSDGIRVGSIIEGADYDAPPFELLFPFSPEEYEDAMDELEEFVNRHWEYNNSVYYKVRRGDDVCYYWWVDGDDTPRCCNDVFNVGVEAFSVLYPPQASSWVVEYDKWIKFGDGFEVCEYQEDFFD